MTRSGQPHNLSKWPVDGHQPSTYTKEAHKTPKEESSQVIAVSAGGHVDIKGPTGVRPLRTQC